MSNAAKQSDAIVRSLFPDAIADRLYEEVRKKDMMRHQGLESAKRQIRNFMFSPTDGVPTDDDGVSGSQPIADLFPNTTVMFADIAGTIKL
jgi:hypothetical protein